MILCFAVSSPFAVLPCIPAAQEVNITCWGCASLLKEWKYIPIVRCSLLESVGQWLQHEHGTIHGIYVVERNVCWNYLCVRQNDSLALIWL